MTITVQVQAGTVDNANSYGTVADMRAHFLLRAVSLVSYTDDQLSGALVRATDFLDQRYSFIGDQLRSEQGTMCPRYLSGSNSHGRNLRDVNTLGPAYLLTTRQWQALVTACFQLAYRTKDGTSLIPDPARDTSGLEITEKKVVAGPVETTKKYAASRAGQKDAAVPVYPEVDLGLRNAGLLYSSNSGTLMRA